MRLIHVSVAVPNMYGGYKLTYFFKKIRSGGVRVHDRLPSVSTSWFFVACLFSTALKLASQVPFFQAAVHRLRRGTARSRFLPPANPLLSSAILRESKGAKHRDFELSEVIFIGALEFRLDTDERAQYLKYVKLNEERTSKLGLVSHQCFCIFTVQRR
ncbi:hypothetical protein [Parapedobacter sp. 10938]|uniref:hypothetical protein n=1 Tax=Parapedobacter flavus TaxID=3110225 RepID=UPI002DB9B9FC|nr:hypothetical protein [Parapedobacter sp. 10938]MEC3881425.1 hypothetical protein [Parapedobacter sp. 10938]